MAVAVPGGNRTKTKTKMMPRLSKMTRRAHSDFFHDLWGSFLSLRPISGDRREVARRAAWAAWGGLLEDGHTPAEIMAAARNYLSEAVDYDRERVFYLGTFLSGAWEDWLDNEYESEAGGLERPCFG